MRIDGVEQLEEGGVKLNPWGRGCAGSHRKECSTLYFFSTASALRTQLDTPMISATITPGSMFDLAVV